jgi:hypothetical protein
MNPRTSRLHTDCHTFYWYWTLIAKFNGLYITFNPSEDNIAPQLNHLKRLHIINHMTLIYLR